jgi:poly [ADP-ribose] polymerase
MEETSEVQRPTLESETGLSPVSVLEGYSAHLNLTDVNYGIKGHNKFYVIQVLESNGFYLWTKWGRVGVSSPFNNLAKCSSKAEAVIEFKKKFRAKTKNEWGEPFHYSEGKYHLVDVESSSLKMQIHLEQEKRRKELEKNAISFELKLEEKLASLMRLVWDFEKMARTMKELNFDPDQCPLGKLSTVQIQKGYSILKRIQHVLETSNRESQVIELSNQFYSNIPQSFGMKKPPTINHLLKVKEKLTLLENLQEMEIANSLSIRCLKLLESNHPLDVYYSQLKCNIKPAHPEITAKVAAWVRETTAESHKMILTVLDVFQVERLEENARFWPFSKLDNRKILWHGSRITNFVGILSNGLKIAPKQAPSSGYMFGKGIYLADICSKAARYCHASSECPEGLLMICEVALGRSHSMLRARGFKRPPQNFHSVMGVGKNAPAVEEEVENGLKIFRGSIEPNPMAAESDLQFNEYVVYDVGQVRMRFLVRVKFEFLTN